MYRLFVESSVLNNLDGIETNQIFILRDTNKRINWYQQFHFFLIGKKSTK